MNALDDNEQNNEHIKHNEEALALMEFIAIGERGIAEEPQSFEDVKKFLSVI